jgi:N-methylhydantoinase A/oxoprolinase/acetone carboxylase beta subunit
MGAPPDAVVRWARSVETGRRFPIRLLESGPAAGALAAARFGRATGQPNLLSFDMGGTTAKLCMVEDGSPLTTGQSEVARACRFKRGSSLARTHIGR